MQDQVTLQKLFGGPSLQTLPMRLGKPPKFSTFVKIIMALAGILILIGLIYVTHQVLRLIERVKTSRKKELISEPPKKEVTEDITYEEIKPDDPKDTEVKDKDEQPAT